MLKDKLVSKTMDQRIIFGQFTLIKIYLFLFNEDEWSEKGLCFSLSAIPDLSHVVCLLKTHLLGESGSISVVSPKLSFPRSENTANYN